MTRCYVLATLGTSPAVLSELLYAMVAEKGYDVVGLEVWTTVEGCRRLTDWLDGGAWRRLGDALSEQRGDGAGERVPSASRAPRDLASVVSRLERGERAFEVREFFRGDEPLDDVRSPEDARAMDATLFQRVQALTAHLGDVKLIGSLAGGRKTMSAGLQGAFSLLGRPGDELVHVLLHPRVEAMRDANYVVPTRDVADRTGVPIETQIALHDVHFPRLRELLSEGRIQQKSISEMLQEDYPSFLASISRLQSGQKATLKRHERKLKIVYTISTEDGITERIELPFGPGTALAALALENTEATLEQVTERLMERGALDCESEESLSDLSYENQQRLKNRVVKHLRSLSERLLLLRPKGLGQFAVGSDHNRYWVPAAVKGVIRVNDDVWG